MVASHSIRLLKRATGITDLWNHHVQFCTTTCTHALPFEIAEDGRGHWVAKEKQGLIGGVFRSRKDALRFALFEVAGDGASARVLPPTGS